MNDKSLWPLLLGIAAPLLVGIAMLCVCAGILAPLFKAPKSPEPVPQYKVLDRMDVRGAPRTVEIAVPDFSRQTSIADIEKVAARIVDLEQADRLAIFSTWSAWKAQYSESYMREHPEAREGYLGVYQHGRFKPAF